MAAVSSSMCSLSRKPSPGSPQWTTHANPVEVRRDQIWSLPGIRSEQPSVSSSCAMALVKKKLCNDGGKRFSMRTCSLVNDSWKILASPHDLDMAVKEEARWARVQLLERELEVAVSEENYADATRLRDQLVNLRTHLSPTEKFLLLNVERLKKGNMDQKLEAIDALGEHGDEQVLSSLIDGLVDSDPEIISRTEKASWKIFLRSGDAETDRLLKKGINLLETNDTYTAARDIFSQVIEKAPNFAEGYNKRATVNYLMGDYEKSIKDCQVTIQLNPYHFAARSGLGLCYAATKDYTSAVYWFEQAYAMHHGLSQIKKCIDNLKKYINN